MAIAPEMMLPGSVTGDLAQGDTGPGMQPVTPAQIPGQQSLIGRLAEAIGIPGGAAAPGGDILGNIARAVAGGVSIPLSETSPAAGQQLAQQVAMQREQIRKQKAANEIAHMSSTLQSAFMSGDMNQMKQALTHLGSMEGAEPETIQHASQLGLQMSQQIGSLAKRQQGIQALEQVGLSDPNGPLGPQGPILAQAVKQGLLAPEDLFKMMSEIQKQQQQHIALSEHGALIRQPGAKEPGLPPGWTRVGGAPGMSSEDIQGFKIPKEQADIIARQPLSKQQGLIGDVLRLRQQGISENRLAAMIDERSDPHIKSTEAALWVDEFGDSLSPKQVAGKRISEIPEGAQKLTPTMLPSLQNAKALVPLAEKIRADAAKILPKYKANNLSGIIEVQGNRFVMGAKGKAGDPVMQRLLTNMNEYQTMLPMAGGIPGGRESNALIERFSRGTTLNTSIEGLNEALNAGLGAIAGRWWTRGINIQGGRRVERPVQSTAPTFTSSTGETVRLR